MENQLVSPTPPVFIQTPVEPEQVKKSFPWLIVAVIAFLLSGSSVLAYKYYQLKQQLTQTQPNPSPTPFPEIPPADPTADWKTYTNAQYGYIIKYPANYLVGFFDELAGEFITSSGDEHQVDILPSTSTTDEFNIFLRILVFDTKTFNEFNKPLAELADNIYQQQKSHFKTTYISNLTKSKFDGYDDYEYLFSGPSLFMLNGSTSVKDGKYKVIFSQKDGNIYSLYLKDSDLFSQILSTFKFTSEGEEGQLCGGFGGISCPEGYSCKYDGNYPDAGGVCTITTEEIPAITKEELSQGWYWAYKNQKKLNTPANWIYAEDGRSSCWHKPDTQCTFLPDQ